MSDERDGDRHEEPSLVSVTLTYVFKNELSGQLQVPQDFWFTRTVYPVDERITRGDIVGAAAELIDLLGDPTQGEGLLTRPNPSTRLDEVIGRYEEPVVGDCGIRPVLTDVDAEYE